MLDPPFLRSFPANEYGVSMVKIYRMVVTIVYVVNHHKDHVGWIGLTPKIIFKNSFVPPRPNMPTTSHLKGSCPLLTMNSLKLVVNDSVPAIKRKKLVI
jgi:hypothetical protein